MRNKQLLAQAQLLYDQAAAVKYTLKTPLLGKRWRRRSDDDREDPRGDRKEAKKAAKCAKQQAVEKEKEEYIKEIAPYPRYEAMATALTRFQDKFYGHKIIMMSKKPFAHVGKVIDVSNTKELKKVKALMSVRRLGPLHKREIDNGVFYAPASYQPTDKKLTAVMVTTTYILHSMHHVTHVDWIASAQESSGQSIQLVEALKQEIGSKTRTHKIVTQSSLEFAHDNANNFWSQCTTESKMANVYIALTHMFDPHFKVYANVQPRMA